MKIIIDPGHGGKDPGGGSNDYWLEKDKNLEISLYQYERFKALGVDVELTRHKDIYLSPTERTNIVKKSGASICISNHINAGGGEGAETIYSIYSDGKLANMIMEELVASGQKKRRVFCRESTKFKGKDYYYMHRDTGKTQTIIVEYGFADNESDTKRINSDWEEYAEAVVRAVCRYINHQYVAPGSNNNDDWKFEGLNYLHEKGLLNDIEGWKKKIDEPMPVWAVTILLAKMYKKLKEEK